MAYIMILFLLIAWIFGVRFLAREHHKKRYVWLVLKCLQIRAKVMMRMAEQHQAFISQSKLPQVDLFFAEGGIVSGTPTEYETGQRLELGPLPGASVNIQISDPINQEWLEKFHKALNDEKPETD